MSGRLRVLLAFGLTVGSWAVAAVPAQAQEDRARMDPRCAVGRVVCIDKSTQKLRWMIDGDVQFAMSVRFGPVRHPTREGDFRIYWKDRHHVSALTGEPMEYSLFFSRGEAIHYSPDFAARGFHGASSGCIDTRDLPGTRALWAATREGDRVVVYRGSDLRPASRLPSDQQVREPAPEDGRDAGPVGPDSGPAGPDPVR